MINQSLARLRSATSEVFRPRPAISLSQWCEDNMRLSPQFEATAGPYNLVENPFWREPLDAIRDPFVRQITIKKSTQVGGTLLLIAAVLGCSELDPSPYMIVGPDEGYTAEVSQRTYGNAEVSPRLAGRIPPERLRNQKHIDMDTCRGYLAWAGSAQRLRGRACKRVFRSEIDVYPDQTPKGGDPIKASGERVKRFPDYTIYDESSPDGDQSRIAAMYDSGHRAQWFVECPQCGKWQVLRFFVFRDGPHKGHGGIAGFKDADDNFKHPDEARHDAHYLCVNGCLLSNVQVKQAVKHGKWVADGQSIEDGEVVGSTAKSRRHLSFHIWSIHSPTITLSDIAVSYLEHRRDSQLRDFFQNWLGLQFETRTKTPEWHILGKRLETDYQRGTIPQEAWFVTAGVDVQQEGCWYVIRAWGDQSTSWLVDHGYVQRYDVEDADLSALTDEQLNEYIQSDIRQLTDAVVNRWWPIVAGQTNPRGQTRLRARLIGIDSQHRTREVHAWVARSDERRVRAIRGDHKTKPQDRWRETVVEAPRRGGPAYISKRTVLNVFTPHFKEAIHEKFLLPNGAPGAFHFYSGIVSTAGDYLKQLVNERPIDEIDKSTGRRKTVWRPRFSQWGNHLGDCEVYGMTMAEVLLAELNCDWDASRWVRKAQAGQQRVAQMTVAMREDQL